MATELTTIVFDLGGVLIDWNPRYLYRKIFSDDVKMEAFLQDVCHGRWNEMQDAGRAFREAVDERVGAYPEYRAEIIAYHERWSEMLGGAIESSVEILKRLHKLNKYRLLALSNWSAETFPIARARFDFLSLFEAIVLSGEEKLVKPDPKFFEILRSRFGVEPSQALFIDDVAQNIAGARKFGMQTLLFKADPPDSLARELRERFNIDVSSRL